MTPLALDTNAMFVSYGAPARLKPAAVGEAMECLGGNAYVEDSILARYYREAPVNASFSPET